MRYIIFIFIVIVLNSGASVYPFNMGKHKYLALSMQEKLSLWEEQAGLPKRLRYKEYEKNILVDISQGDFKHMKHSYYIAPFTLAKNEVKKIPVYNKKYNTFHHYIWVTYQDTGLYLGVTPHNKYKRGNKYVSSDIDFFSKISYFNRPAIVFKNNKWRHGSKQRASFEGKYNAYNLQVRVKLQTKRVYYEF